MKTKSRNLIVVFLMVFAFVCGVFAITPLTANAQGGTGTKDDPVICSTYSEFKTAMEDSNIRYVELKNCNEVLPKISGEGLISAISVAGIKHLSLTGNNVFTVSADSDGYKSYDSLLHLQAGSTMTVEGGGSLTFKANLSNGRNAVIYNQGGSIAIYSGTLKGSYNTAVYGMAIWQDSGDVEIIDGSFISDSAIPNNNPKYSVYLGGGRAWIRGGSFTSVNTSNTQAPLYGLCIETGAIADISGGEFDGILLPTDTTPMSNYVQNYKTVLVNESPIDATSANCQALVGSGKSVRIVELIREIKINTETPMAGMNISDLQITLGGGYSLAMYYPQWYKNEEYVSSGTFEQGANYSVELLLERNKTYNYEFASNVTATVNGKAVAVNAVSGLNKSQFVEITYDFGVCCDVIDTVNLTVSAPVEHQTHGGVSRPSGVTSYSVNDTHWYMSDTGTDGTWVSMPDNHQFTAGKYYKVSVDVKASDGYLFKVNRDLDPDIIGNINGYSADVSRVYEQAAEEYVCLTYNFGVCNDSVIEKIVIDNITAPVAGETPSYSLSVQGSAYKSEGESGFDTKNGVQWTDVTNGNTILYDDTKFIPGHTYQVTIYLHAEENYTFATTGGENYPATTATVNGNPATVVNKSNSSKYQTVTYEFVCPKKNISSFEINDLAIPQADAAPDTSATTPYPEYYAVESVTWYNTNKTQMEANAKFEEGKSYLVEVKLIPGSYGANAITFLNNPDAFINGEKVYTLSEWDEIEIRLGAIYVRYTFPTIPLSETPVNSYMVSYYPGEAEGSPDSDMIDDGTEITLADCMFETPEGKQFKAWAIGSVNGEQKQPGDNITITAETYIYAIWEDIPVTEYMVSYYPGEAEGSPDSDMIDDGTEITLADCMFETPEGKQFKAWAIGSVNGEQKQPGDKITITAETYIYAIWEDLPHECVGVIESGQGATCTVDGWKDYYRCECEKYYEDANCEILIPDLEAWKVGDGKITATHSGTPEWIKTATTHAKKYTCCETFVIETEAHEWNNGTCSECGYVCLHTSVAVTKKDGQGATCTVDGWKDYYQCACGKYFADEARTTPISDLETWKANDGKILAKHEYGNLIPEESAVHTTTELKAGLKAHYYCSVCETYFDENKVETTLLALTIAKPEHVYGDFITSDSDKHWKQCSCGLKSELGDHDYTDELDTDCNTCGHIRNSVHVHGNGVKQDGKTATCTENGWHEYYKCNCNKLFADVDCTIEITVLEDWKNGDGKILASHNYGELIEEVKATCSATGKQAHYHCSVCGTFFNADKEVKDENELIIAIDVNAHNFGGWTSNGDGTHTRVCSLNGEHKETADCSGGTATCTEKAVCSTCNTAYGNTAQHNHGTTWESDANNHWNECTCGDKANVGTHADSDNNGKCDVCDYDMPTTPGGSGSETPKQPETPDKPNDGLSGGAIAGIVVGSVAVAGLGGFALVWFVIKKKTWAEFLAIFKKK